MSDVLTPMTELEAVNEMLSAIGESPIASLVEADGVADASTALKLLRLVNRWLQTKGWHWNTEHNWELSPDVNGNIVLPSNCVKVDPVDIDKDYIARAGKLWDRTNRTYTFTDTVKVNIVFLYNFEELPETARQFITQAATRRFENRLQGDPGAHQVNQNDAIQAWADLVQEECDSADYNVIRNSRTVRRIVTGRYGMRGEY